MKKSTPKKILIFQEMKLFDSKTQKFFVFTQKKLPLYFWKWNPALLYSRKQKPQKISYIFLYYRKRKLQQITISGSK